MANSAPIDLGLSLSIAFFVLSFSWLFVQRTESIPNIHRLTSVFSNSLIPDINSVDFRVMAWGYSYMLIWIAAASWSFFQYAILLEPTLFSTISSLIIGPIFCFLAPQAISASTTLLIFWRVPEDYDEGQYPAFEAYQDRIKARKHFIVTLIISIGLVYGVPITLWGIQILG